MNKLIQSSQILPVDQIVPMTTTHIATSHVDSCGYCVRETRRHVTKAGSKAKVNTPYGNLSRADGQNVINHVVIAATIER